MTRINLVPVQELTDQHLFAEFREIKMVPMSLRRSLAARGIHGVMQLIPPAYVLGKGHVSFFYDKGEYLRRRYADIRRELGMRGINYDPHAPLDPYYVQAHTPFTGDYEPTPEALALVRARIAERIAKQPEWYRYKGKPYEHRA